MARFRPCRRHLLNSLRSTVDYRPTLPRLIRTLVGSQKLQILQTSCSLYCAYRRLRTGLRGMWCSLKGGVSTSLRETTAGPTAPSVSYSPSILPSECDWELAYSLRNIRRQCFGQNSVKRFPLFDKDNTTLLPSLRFSRTNTSPCIVLFQEKCNVC